MSSQSHNFYIAAPPRNIHPYRLGVPFKGRRAQIRSRCARANAIETLQFRGSGATFSASQNFAPNDLWPRVTVKHYTALVNYETGSMRQESLREMGATMPRGGGVPFTGLVNISPTGILR